MIPRNNRELLLNHGPPPRVKERLYIIHLKGIIEAFLKPDDIFRPTRILLWDLKAGAEFKQMYCGFTPVFISGPIQASMFQSPIPVEQALALARMNRLALHLGSTGQLDLPTIHPSN